jgi:NADPH:quinone reductase-like Zn-dependent oxidoreductase
MKAARILRFGPLGVITNDNLPRPEPAAGQLLVHVKAAGVGHWDALIREGKLNFNPPSYSWFRAIRDRRSHRSGGFRIPA